MNSELQINKFGNASVLRLVKTERKTPQAGEVEVKVEASSMAFTDTLLRRGIYPGMKKQFPLTLGYDFVGIVSSIGEGVTDVNIGDRVGALTISGSNADYIIHKADDLFKVPVNVDAAEAESLILSWVTAYQMLFRVAKVQKGSSILVHGAAGGVGHALVRLAQYFDIKVVATARPEDFEDLRKHNVKFVFDYNDKSLWQKLLEKGKYDAVFDGVSETNFKKSYVLLKEHGTLVCFGFSAKGKGVERVSFKITLLSLLMVVKTLLFVFTHKKAQFYDIKRMKATHLSWFKEDISILLDLLNQQKIHAQVTTIPFHKLEAIQTLHTKLTEGGVKGRIAMIHEKLS